MFNVSRTATKPSKRAKPTRSTKRIAEKAVLRPAEEIAVDELRARYALTRAAFGRLLGVSLRKLADLEHGRAALSEPTRRRLREAQRLFDGLSDVVTSDAIGPWIQTPNPSLDGFKPLELIERGETDRIWRIIYVLGSGVPV